MRPREYATDMQAEASACNLLSRFVIRVKTTGAYVILGVMQPGAAESIVES
jgi:hypothetical protein